MRGAAAVLLGVLALALGACGGDDNGGSSGDSSAQRGYAAPGESTTGSQSGTNGGGAQQGDGQGGNQGSGGSDSGGTSGSGGKGGKRSNGEVPSLDLGNKGPAPKAKKRQGSSNAEVPRGAPRPRSDFKGLELQIYESSRYFCNRAGVDGMRAEYGIESENPGDIAREAARRNEPRGFPEAVYSGCLEGLIKAN